MKSRSTLLILMGILATSTPVNASQLKLSNGDLLSGDVVRIEAKSVLWKSPILGSLTVPKSNVALIDGKPLTPTPTPTPETATAGRSFTGRVNLGMEKDEGSSDSEEYDLKVKSSLSYGRYVHTLKAEHEVETKSDRITEEDYEVNYQAERYFTPNTKGWFMYGLGAWNKDRFRSPQEWTTLGSGAGYSWQPSKQTRVKMQFGADHWHTSDSNSNGGTAIGGRLMLDLEYKLVRLADIVIFHESELIWELGNATTRRLETTTGFRVPVTKRLSFELSADHDRFKTEDEPEFDISLTDHETEWNAKVGYVW